MNLFRRGVHRDHGTRHRDEGWENCVCHLPVNLEPGHINNVWACPRCGIRWQLVGLTYRTDGRINSAHWNPVTVTDEEIAAFFNEQAQ